MTEGNMDSIDKALQLSAKSYLPDATPMEVIKTYDDVRCSSYDETTVVLQYKCPKVVADAVARYLPHTRDVRVLDVAAGTGLVGEQLHAHGFTNIDALDPSVGMLDIARQKNVYRDLIQEFFPSDETSVKTSSYDVLVVSGGMSGGHMKCDCLPEMVRCVKTDGLVVIGVREIYLTKVAEYKDRLEPLMKQLETEGQWQMLERSIMDDYILDHSGILFVFKVTK